MAERIGEQLYQARLSSGLSLEQISNELHIRVQYLRALEEDTHDVMASRTQARGFLRLYADYLGLPVVSILARFDGKPDPAFVPLQPSAVESPEEIPAAASSMVVEESASAPSKTIKHLIQRLKKDQIETSSTETAPVIFTDQVSSYTPSQPAPAPVVLSESQIIFKRIGEKLSARRESLNLSLADVERYTHVRQRYLDALEQGRMDLLPSFVQGRGMLNNYASFLNMEVDPLLSDFADALQTRRVELAPSIETTAGKKKTSTGDARVAPFWKRILSPDLVYGGGLILGLLVFMVWAISQIGTIVSTPETTPPPSVAEMLLSTTTVPSDQTTLTSAAPLTTLSAAERATPEPSTPEPTITLPAGVTGAVQINIVAKQRTYVKVTVDGTVQFDGRVIPGNAYTYAGNETIEVITGSAAALQIFYKQQDLGSLGGVGEVKSFIFTTDIVITPTSAFTPTPTRTTMPTSTLQPTETLPAPTITPFVP